MLKPHTAWLALFCALSACSSGPDGTHDGDNAAPVGTEGWQSLFDGSTLDGWHTVGEADWQTVDNTVQAVVGDSSGFLVTDADYGDFDLSLEFWVSDEANSGVFIRCMDHQEIGADSCYEVNIFDMRPDPTYGTGAIVNFVPPAETVSTGGKWNRYEISARGDRLSARLNDIDMFDIEDSTYKSGPIALQYGSGTVIFRDIQIRTP